MRSNSCSCASACGTGDFTIISGPTATPLRAGPKSARTRRSSQATDRTSRPRFETVREIGSNAELGGAIADAFPGAGIEIVNADGYFELEMRQAGLLRPLKAAELSDGTLRYLLLIAALLSPRPPSLMILNEPETSLHPDLLPPLARLIAQASKRSQIVVVSHAAALVSALDAAAEVRRIVLEKQLGETLVPGDETPAWTWPSR